ncbi:hypothetical protein GGC63_003802 [Paenibacillus sp. OAS669]|nr:hypothetical protein [Paenibacillus sp. OAS669]
MSLGNKTVDNGQHRVYTVQYNQQFNAEACGIFFWDILCFIPHSFLI